MRPHLLCSIIVIAHALFVIMNSQNIDAYNMATVIDTPMQVNKILWCQRYQYIKEHWVAYFFPFQMHAAAEPILISSFSYNTENNRGVILTFL